MATLFNGVNVLETERKEINKITQPIYENTQIVPNYLLSWKKRYKDEWLN